MTNLRQQNLAKDATRIPTMQRWSAGSRASRSRTARSSSRHDPKQPPKAEQTVKKSATDSKPSSKVEHERKTRAKLPRRSRQRPPPRAAQDQDQVPQPRPQRKNRPASRLSAASPTRYFSMRIDFARIVLVLVSNRGRRSLTSASAGCRGEHGPSEGGLGRGDHRVPARQRPAGPALSRSVAAQGHRQPDRPRRLATRGLRRDGHGPPARAHGLQGDADPPRHPRRDEGARSPVQRHHLVRPHQLLRDTAGQRREPRVRHQARGRPDGQQPDQGRGSLHRVLGGPQRVRDGREFSRIACCRSG